MEPLGFCNVATIDIESSMIVWMHALGSISKVTFSLVMSFHSETLSLKKGVVMLLLTTRGWNACKCPSYPILSVSFSYCELLSMR